ncbi:retrovirus-related Pol polyprotein from transposon 17.6 [Trichonephila clavipes]|nr:retrovirus-related Pol polyprotein from transposon 17.6 [Trichonephila clavipes]
MNMEINGIDRVCLRDSGSSIDVCSRSWINEDDLLGEYVWLKSPLDEICHCLPLAKIKIKTKKGEFYTKAAIKQDSSDNDLYLLGNRTAELLSQTNRGDVEEFVKTCDSCQRVGKPRDKAKAPPEISADYFGASKYPEAIPVESITSPNVIDALLSIFSRIGFPREIQSDLGTSFTSELTTTFFNKFGIKVTRSSVSHPQSNAVERVHRTIKRVIKALCVESGEDWEGVLPLALFSLRTVAHESTGFSPTELVMGKNLRTPQTSVIGLMLFRKLLRGESIAWPIHRPEPSFKGMFLLAFISASRPQNVKKQVREWAKACIRGQKCKVSRHTKSKLGEFEQPDERFSVVHINLIGKLPPSEGTQYCLTCIDRFSCSMEAIPIPEITAEIVGRAFYEKWICRFGVPAKLVTYQGRQFEAELFRSIAAICGAKVAHTTSYHP